MSLFAVENFASNIAVLLSIACFAVVANHREAKDYEISLSFSFFAILTSLGYLGNLQSAAVETALVFTTKIKYIGLFMQFIVLLMVYGYFKVKIPRWFFIIYLMSSLLILMMVLNFNFKSIPLPGNPMSWLGFTGRWFFKNYYIQMRRGLVFLRSQNNWGYCLFVATLIMYAVLLAYMYVHVILYKRILKLRDLTVLFASLVIPTICFLYERLFLFVFGQESLPIVPWGIIVSDCMSIYLVVYRRFYNVNSMASDTFFDKMETPAIVVNDTFRITNINSAIQELFSFVERDVIGQRVMSAFPDYLIRPFESLISFDGDQMDSGLQRNNKLLISDDNLVFVNDKTFQPRVRRIMNKDQVIGFVLSLDDVTLLHNYKMTLEDDVSRKTDQIRKMRDQMAFSLAYLAEHHDLSSKGHLTRTSYYTEAIARELLREGTYTDVIDESFIHTISCVAPLHDIGKVYVDEKILNKNGPLTPEERLRMESHTVKGADFLDTALKDSGDSLYSDMAHDIALYHHEWWNGSGYPTRISGTKIPVSSRIMAVADVFDALLSERPYKKAFTLAEAYDIIHYQSGTHFDPAVVTAFEAITPEIQDIIRQMKNRDL
ncbi:MAG: HD domain-containing protein [Treponema sp.]|nr:HD domain-containing protein [Treponema sp.]